MKPTRKIIVIIFCLGLLFLRGTFCSSLVFALDDLVTLLAKGRLKEAREVMDESGKKNLPLEAVMDYAHPHWYPGDISGLEDAGSPGIEILRQVINSPLSPEASGEYPQDAVETRARLMEGLARIQGDKAGEVLIPLLDSPSPMIRLGAVRALNFAPSPGAALALYQYLRTEKIPDFSNPRLAALSARMESTIRTRAVTAIIEMKCPELAEELKEDLNSSGSPDQLTAAIILTGMKDPALRETYISMQSMGDENLRVYGASALKEIGDNQGIDEILKLFREGDIQKKHWMIQVLAGWEHPRAAETLVEYLGENTRDEPASDHFPSLAILGKVPELDQISDPSASLLMKVIQVLISWRDLSVPLLTGELEKKPGSMEYFILEILAESQNPSVIPIFRERLDPENPLACYYALWGLGRLKDKESSETIAQFLDSPLPALRIASAWSLCRMGDSRGYQVSVKALKERDVSMASTGMDALYHLQDPRSGEPVKKSLMEGFEDSIPQRSGIILLGLLGDSSARELLEEIAGQGSVNSFYAAQALYRINGRKTSFSTRRIHPRLLDQYCHGWYGPHNDIQALVLYIRLSPWDYFPVDDFTLALIRDDDDTDEDESRLWQDPEGEASQDIPAPGVGGIALLHRGVMTRLLLPWGEARWVPTSRLILVEDSTESARRRFRWDRHYRWGEDLQEIILKDYMGGSPPIIQLENPQALTGAYYAQMMLDCTLNLSGQKTPMGDSLARYIDTGQKRVTFRSAGNATSIIFDGHGRVSGFMTDPRRD